MHAVETSICLACLNGFVTVIGLNSLPYQSLFPSFAMKPRY
jgi:hypothetical protein